METVQKLTRKSVPALRTALGLLFMYAGAAKAMDVTAFAAQIHRFGVGSSTIATVLAHYLPFLEIMCGLALLIRCFATGATLLCVGLLVSFEVGLAYAWYHGYEGACGCFGKLFGGTSIQAAFLRNLILLTIAGMSIVRELSSLQKEGR